MEMLYGPTFTTLIARESPSLSFHNWIRKLLIYSQYVMGYAQPLHWGSLNLFQSNIN